MILESLREKRRGNPKYSQDFILEHMDTASQCVREGVQELVSVDMFL